MLCFVYMALMEYIEILPGSIEQLLLTPLNNKCSIVANLLSRGNYG